MLRILLAALALAAIPAAAFDLEKWADKLGDRMIKGHERDQLEALFKSRDPKERLEAADWLAIRDGPHIIAALAGALSDSDPRVRERAASALWSKEKKAEDARPQLLKALDDPHPNVVARAAGALEALGMDEKALVAPRKRVFNSPDASLTARFLVSRNLIGHEPNPRLLEPTLAYLDQAVTAKGHFTRTNIELAEDALKELIETKDKALLPPLMDAIRAGRPSQPRMMRALRKFPAQPDGYMEFAFGFFAAPSPEVRKEALEMLRDLKKSADVVVWVPRAAAMLNDPDYGVRFEALWALGSAGGLAAGEIDKVVAALSDPHPTVRAGAARAIGEIGERRQARPAAARARVLEAGRPALVKALENDPENDVRRYAKDALRNLGDAPMAAAAKAPSEAGESAAMMLLRDRKVTFEESSFSRALYEGDVELVRAFLDAGMPIGGSVSDNGPPIRVMFFSATACQPTKRPTKPETKALLKLLLERGADPNGADKNGNTALMEAATHGCDRELTRMLIKAGAKVNATNAAGLTPFEMGLYFAHDGLEEILAAGYRLPPDKAKMYAEGYKGRAATQEMIKKATRK